MVVLGGGQFLTSEVPLYIKLEPCPEGAMLTLDSSSFSVLLSSLELSDTKVYEPQIRALLGTASHLCEVVVLKLRTVPTGNR